MLLTKPISKLIRRVRKLASNEWAALPIVILIPLIGLVIEFLGFEDAFQRSGSALVSVAILFVFVNHFLYFELSWLKEALIKVVQMDEIYRDAISQLNSRRQIAGNEEVPLNEDMLDVHLKIIEDKESNIESLEEITRNIILIEFFAGFFGTLIWGFGDIII